MIPEKDFFDKSKQDPQDPSWIQTLHHLPGNQQVVLMDDLMHRRFAFQVSINEFDHDLYVISFNDISETMKEHLDWKYRASHDPLTDAFNRNFFEHNHERIVQECYHKRKLPGFLLFDIDHFKKVNDTYGHNQGDQVLSELAELVKSSIRDTDYLIRWGGEEFILIFPTDNHESVEKFAHNLRSRIEEKLFTNIGKVTCSFGGTILFEEEALESVVERADQAMYFVKCLLKEHGRNGVKVM